MKNIILILLVFIGLSLNAQIYTANLNINPVTDPLIAAELGNSTAVTTLSGAVSVDDIIINVVSATGMSVGNNLFIIDEDNLIVETFEILSIATNAITVDMPAGNSFLSGEFVGSSNTDFSVDGSSTPVKFNLKTGLESADFTVLIARIIITMETSSAVSMDEFGDLTALTNGIYLRRTDGGSTTYFNVKANKDFNGLAYDVDYIEATGPQGQDGLAVRLTFTKFGGFIELEQGEDLELWVQDNLTGIESAKAIVEGYIKLY